MRRLLAVLLMLGMATVASADWNTANHPQPIDKGTYVGDGMGDTREGGEDFGSAMVIGSLPYTDTGATCDNADNITLPCAASAAPDVVYSYVVAAGVTGINVSLCGSGYDTALGIYDGSQVNIACNDDFCGLQSEIDHIAVTAGQTYYIVVDGFSTNCGSYVINVTADVPPPPLECPPGAQLEGEPDCYDGYYDSYNGGCNSTGWTDICPQDGDHAVLCGKSGTYLYQGFSYRDTDWFRLEACGGQVCATWLATFPIQAILIYTTSCPVVSGYDLATGPAGVPVTLCRNLTGEFWLWAGASQFNGIPCGSDYQIDVTGICAIPGACEVPVQSKSWGAIKNLYNK